MSMTPGPWSFSKIDDRAAFNIFTPGRCSALLTLEPGKHDGADPRIPNVEADARLIAAAPELLEALKQIDETANIGRGSFGDEWAFAEVLRLARAALNKAGVTHD